MSQMATVPVPEWSGASDSRRSVRSTAVRCVAALAGSALLGLLGGLIWGEFAPRAQLQEISAGTAELINAETRAFIGADAWFCAIAVVAGLITGILGYRYAMGGRSGTSRPLVALCLILGAVGGGFIMLWLGGQIGLTSYDQHLASSPDGTLFSASLSLGAKSALAFWPMITSIVVLVAEWSNHPGRQDPQADWGSQPGREDPQAGWSNQPGREDPRGNEQ